MRFLALTVALSTSCGSGRRGVVNNDGGGGSDATSCTGSACSDPCAAAAAAKSYIGCDYWPVDLDNGQEVIGPPDPSSGCTGLGFPDLVLETIPVCWDDTLMRSNGSCDYGSDCSASPGTTCQMMPICLLDGQHAPFAVVVSNPNSSAATVTLANAAGMTHAYTVAPGAVQPIFPQSDGFPDQSLDYSGIAMGAYHLTSTLPITAYQFNPLDNVHVFSNDASLLLPSTTFDKSYYVASYPTATRRPNTNDYNGFVTVVASAPGTTTVTVTTTAGVRAGEGVPAFAAGSPQMFTLSQFQTLNLEAVQGGDLTGSLVSASQPIGVFGGHESAFVGPTPSTAPCCADHLEDQIFPMSTWGEHYELGLSPPRTPLTPDVIRIVAERANTTITTNPSIGTCPTLGPGQFCELDVTGDVDVTASQPVLVAHYITGNNGAGAADGDPSLSFAVPVEQFRTSYAFLIPQQYATNAIAIVAPVGGSVSLDATDVTSQLASFASGGYKAGRFTIGPGAHSLDCPDKCSVDVYGYGHDVSYMFAGGLDLTTIIE
jgi:hypothetical protein